MDHAHKPVYRDELNGFRGLIFGMALGAFVLVALGVVGTAVYQLVRAWMVMR